MPKNLPKRILAIDPGTRYLGFAVVEGKRLLYHGVREFSGHRGRTGPCRAARRAVDELIHDLEPDVLALEDAFHSSSRNLAAQEALVRALRSLGRRRGLTIVCYAPATVRKYLCGSGWANKRAVAFMVTLRYPQLRPYIVRERLWKERFHGHMFDAVAVGLMARSRL